MELKDEADLTISKERQRTFVQGENIFPIIEHPSGRRSIQGPEDMKKRRLPDTRSAHNGQCLPRPDDEIDSFEDVHPLGPVSKGLEELLNLNKCVTHSAVSQRGPVSMPSTRDRGWRGG